MVSRMLAYGLVWDGIRIPLGRAVRDGADRVEEPRDRVPLRLRGVAPHRADGCRGGWGSRSRSGTRGVWPAGPTRPPRPPPWGGAARLWMAKLDRVGESGGDGQAGPPGGGETQPGRAPERRRVERGRAARH